MKFLRLYTTTKVTSQIRGRRCHFFLSCKHNKLLACDRAVQCSKSMLTVVKQYQSILNQYDYPGLNVKIGMDEGENVIVQLKCGHDRSSLIDILGYCMNIAA